MMEHNNKLIKMEKEKQQLRKNELIKVQQENMKIAQSKLAANRIAIAKQTLQDSNNIGSKFHSNHYEIR